MKYQLTIDNLKFKNCAFTGHRDFKGRQNVEKLEKCILGLIECGIENFYCGMAAGFDLCAAESVIKLKDTFDIKLFACIPCPEQDKYFSANLKRRYRAALEKCDGKFVIAPSYFTGCMQMRDRYLVDNCDILLYYLNKTSGGTYYTVNYAKKQGKQILSLN